MCVWGVGGVVPQFLPGSVRAMLRIKLSDLGREFMRIMFKFCNVTFQEKKL